MMVALSILLLLTTSFIFSGIEAGILSVNRVRLMHRVKSGDPAAIKLSQLLEKPARLLVTVLIVTNLMNISAIVQASGYFVQKFGDIGFLITFAVSLPVVLLGLETLPKSLFRRFPYRALAALAEPLRLADLLLSPLHLFGWSVLRMLFGNSNPERRKLFVAREDFKYMTIESERSGALTRVEREMINNVVDFRAVKVSDVMIPMERVASIPARASLEELLERRRKTRFDRWPVVAEDGSVTGVINLFEIALDGRRHGAVEHLQRRIVRVREEEQAFAALRKLRAARVTLAVVGTDANPALGIVSSEDLIKRLVSTAKP